MTSRLRAAELLPLVPAAAIPLLFLHRRYQAHTAFGPVDIFGSDLAVAATVAAAIVAGVWWGFSPLRRLWVLWTIAGGLFLFILASVFWTPLDHTTKHLITAAKLFEYALLAPSVVLLMRRRIDVDRFLLVFVGWSVAASSWGLLQFLGLVNEFSGKRPAQREVSFLGIHDFAGFSAAALAIGLAGIALGERRRMVVVATVSGAVGTILAASAFAFSGIVLAAIVSAVVGRRAGTLTMRRILALAGITIAVATGVYALRGPDVTNFFSFLGNSTPRSTSENIQTGAHRVVLGYIGLRIWQDHPWLGVGLERSTDQYGPYLADAKRKYPEEATSAFPSPEHPWGVQNLWIQTLADLGVVGLALLLATFATGLVLAWQALGNARLPALIAAGWLLVAAGTWNANGILAGLPLDALTWFAFGLAAAAGGVR